MHYVYILKSCGYDEIYVGQTKNLKQRVYDHNYGKSSHTAKYKPWELVAYVSFKERAKAQLFEKYLKTGSGRAFARKHLL